MRENGPASFRWRHVDEEGSPRSTPTSLSGTRWDRAMGMTGQWLLYAVGSIFVGEHVLNFFRTYVALHDLSYRNSEASYGIMAMMFVFAAMVLVTVTALCGYRWPIVAVLTFVVARSFIQFAADDISFGNLLESVVLLVVFGVLAQRATDVESAQELRIADLSGTIQRLHEEVDALKQSQTKG